MKLKTALNRAPGLRAGMTWLACLPGPRPAGPSRRLAQLRSGFWLLGGRPHGAMPPSGPKGASQEARWGWRASRGTSVLRAVIVLDDLMTAMTSVTTPRKRPLSLSLTFSTASAKVKLLGRPVAR